MSAKSDLCQKINQTRETLDALQNSLVNVCPICGGMRYISDPITGIRIDCVCASEYRLNHSMRGLQDYRTLTKESPLQTHLRNRENLVITVTMPPPENAKQNQRVGQNVHDVIKTHLKSTLQAHQDTDFTWLATTMSAANESLCSDKDPEIRERIGSVDLLVLICEDAIPYSAMARHINTALSARSKSVMEQAKRVGISKYPSKMFWLVLPYGYTVTTWIAKSKAHDVDANIDYGVMLQGTLTSNCTLVTLDYTTTLKALKKETSKKFQIPCRMKLLSDKAQMFLDEGVKWS